MGKWDIPKILTLDAGQKFWLDSDILTSGKSVRQFDAAFKYNIFW